MFVDWEKYEREAKSAQRWGGGMMIFFGIGGLAILLATPLKILGFLALALAIYYAYKYLQARDEYNERKVHKQSMVDAFYRARERIVMPQNRNLICEGNFYLWLENNAIKIFAAKWEAEFFQLRTIPITNIIFYSREGEVHTETHGYGGGSSYSMISGWNGKVDPIVITTELKDNRKTVLLYQEKNKDYVLELGYADYLVLKKLIPEKDIAVISNKKAETQIDSLDGKLKTLKSLYEQELISKEEFESRKEQLLQGLR